MRTTRRILSEEEFEAFIDETERKMLGLDPPPNINDAKYAPDFERLNGPRGRVGDPGAIRTFILTHGRAPTREELMKLR